ncbi:MAG: class II glutamine amidotransferase, partial [Candidatus Binatia bacterium]|nr:class II glutamine amidotransferase [Candidatus Binatia bacterium]
TADVAVDQSNCQPFAYQRLLFMHNGYIERFRVTLMRRVREVLRDEYYTAINGSTDSEHIFALFLNLLHGRPVSLPTLMEAMSATISQLRQWADQGGLRLALNCAVTNGECIVISRFSTVAPAPSLYYTVTSPFFPDAAVVASERLCASPEWVAVPASSVMGIDRDLRPSLCVLP